MFSQLSDQLFFFFSTFLLHINKTVSRTQQLALTDWDEQEDSVFIGLQNKLKRKIYAEFCKFSEAENRWVQRRNDVPVKAKHTDTDFHNTTAVVLS